MTPVETLTIDGIEITIAPPVRTADQIAIPDYNIVTSLSLPEGVEVSFYRSLMEFCLTTARPGAGRRWRRFRTLQEARDAAIKYVVNRAKEAQKAA